MKINWLWDYRISEAEAAKILKDENHPKFDIYAERLLARVGDPKTVFGIIDKAVFCRKWPAIKKRMVKDGWLKERVIFWQTIYERVLLGLREEGIRIRRHQVQKIPPERMRLARRIREVRVKSGLTQREAAKRLGVIQQYISRLESGRENVSLDTLKRIADAFHKKLVVDIK